MSRNGTGTYNLPAGNPVVTGTTISSTWANNTLSDIQNALTGSIAADGQTPITGSLIGPSGTVAFGGVGQTRIPSGTTAQRSASPVDGMIRYNTDLQQYEGYRNGAWSIFGNGAGGTLFSDTITATQGQTVINMPTGYVQGGDNLSVYVNGSKQIFNVNYTETSTSSFTFATGLNTGDLVNYTIGASTSLSINAASVLYNEGQTGAVDQNVEQKLQESVSVKDFGAKGDGVTDDTLSIQSAINSGKPLYFPAGIYIVSLLQSINLEGGATVCCLIAKSNMALRGAGWGQSIIKLKNNQSTDASPKYFNIIATNTAVDNILIDGLCFDINGQNNKISPNRGSNVYNKFNCAAFICSGSVATVGQDAYVTNSKFTNNLIKNSPGVTCIGLAQTNSSGTVLGYNIEISNNIFYNNGLDTNDHSSVYSLAENVNIHGNTFYFPTMSTGIQGPLVAAELHGARNFFTNNSIYNYPQGLWIGGNRTNLSYDLVVSNNSFVVSSYGMLFFRESALDLGVQDVVISSNNIWITNDTKTTLLAATKVGIGVTASLGGSSNVVIASNNIKTTDTTQAAAIKVYALGVGTTIKNISVLSNQMQGFATSILTGIASGGSFDEVVINGNSILDCKPNSTSPTFTIGIGYEGANGNLTITNNYISSDASGLYYGIYLAPTSTLTFLVMEANSIDAGATTPINNGVTVSSRRYGYQARTFAALPTQSTWVQGDYAYNASAGQLGAAGSKYIIIQWYRATSGTANVLNTDWFECRSLTGN